MQRFSKRMHPFINSIFFLLVATSLGVADDYTITVDSVGVGNSWKAGEITPIHVSITSNVTDAKAAWIQWEVPDGDGDHVLWGRPITLTPQGGVTTTWLYAPTRPSDHNQTVWTIRLRSWEQNEPTGALLSYRFSPQSVSAQLIKPDQGHIAIFGTRRLGLSDYAPITPREVKIEATNIVSGLNSKDLPDAWPSLNSLDVLVWADTPPEFSFRQSEAILQWIQRGGHLVISLPSIGNPWSIGTSQGALSSLLDGLDTTLEGTPLTSLHNIVGRNRTWPQMNVPIHVFGYTSAKWPSVLTPMVWLEDGRVIAVQKTVGFGAVTIIGVDLASGQLVSLGLPEADVLWNRILGRRSDAPSQRTLNKLDDSKRKSSSIPTTTFLSKGNMASQEIAMSTTAGGRVGTVFLLIILYWLISGPVGYYILKKKGKQRWSWVWFACTAGFFTVGTWFMASIAAGVPIPLKHVTIVDHVYGEIGQRANGWFSVFLPNFGRSEVQLIGEEQNVLFPWTPPSASQTPPFIDRREIMVNLDHVPNTFIQPARATTANFSYQWIGGVEDDFYGSLIRVPHDEEPAVLPPNRSTPNGSLTGSLIHSASVPLEDVTIIWVTDQRLTPPQLGRNQEHELMPWVKESQSGQVLNKAYMWREHQWKAGETMQLDQLKFTPASSFSLAVSGRYTLKDMFDSVGSISQTSWRTRMEMLSLYSHLQPPVYQKKPEADQGPATHNTIRKDGRDLDLSKWFGRPCIIVMGFFPHAPIPVPITLDGTPPTKSDGVTFVRWVYPLETMP